MVWRALLARKIPCTCRAAAARLQRETLQKPAFHRRFCDVWIFCKKGVLPIIFLAMNCACDGEARDQTPRERSAIHKIKRNHCYFSSAGVSGMTVQVDSRLHCTDVA